MALSFPYRASRADLATEDSIGFSMWCTWYEVPRVRAPQKNAHNVDKRGLLWGVTDNHKRYACCVNL